jgi:hypothetical protein
MIALMAAQMRIYDALAEATAGGTVDYIGHIRIDGLSNSAVNTALRAFDAEGVVQIVPKGGPRRFRLLVPPDQVRLASRAEVVGAKLVDKCGRKSCGSDSGAFMRAVSKAHLLPPDDVHTVCHGRYTGMRPDARAL